MRTDITGRVLPTSGIKPGFLAGRVEWWRRSGGFVGRRKQFPRLLDWRRLDGGLDPRTPRNEVLPP